MSCTQDDGIKHRSLKARSSVKPLPLKASCLLFPEMKNHIWMWLLWNWGHFSLFWKINMHRHLVVIWVNYFEGPSCFMRYNVSHCLINLIIFSSKWSICHSTLLMNAVSSGVGFKVLNHRNISADKHMGCKVNWHMHAVTRRNEESTGQWLKFCFLCTSVFIF